MKRDYVNFLYCLLCGLLCGCGTLKKSHIQTHEKEEREHTRLITYHDTVLTAPRREVSLQLPLKVFKAPLNDCPKKVLIRKDKRDKPIVYTQCSSDTSTGSVTDKPMVYTQRNGHAQVRVQVQHDTLRVTAVCDTLKIKAQMKRILEKEWRSREHTQAEKNDRTRGIGLFLVILYVLIAFILGAALEKFFSFF